MKILKLEWRNIFSYGDDITEIDFGDTAKLWQLTGESGSGKSSMLTVPKLLLFGKTEGSDGKPVNVSEIANWVNKKGWIRGTIQKGNDIFVIERTFVPQGLSVTKNGESLDKAGLKNMQTIIETEVLDNMPYHIFSNVMILSLNNFKSFVSMSPADKRQIIDKIFELEIINKVHELVKKDMRDLGNQINISNSQVYSLDQTIKTSTEQLDNVKYFVTDLWETYKDIAFTYFRKAKIVADHFHWAKSICNALDNIRIEVQSNLPKSERKYLYSFLFATKIISDFFGIIFKRNTTIKINLFCFYCIFNSVYF